MDSSGTLGNLNGVVVVIVAVNDVFVVADVSVTVVEETVTVDSVIVV
jgi:hypothetical protein